eukprot:419672-Prymnesium_polylepis.1
MASPRRSSGPRRTARRTAASLAATTAPARDNMAAGDADVDYSAKLQSLSEDEKKDGVADLAKLVGYQK